MHSNVILMLRKSAATMPFGTGAFVVSPSQRGAGGETFHLADSRSRVSRPEVPRLLHLNNNLLIHSFINQTHSL